MHRGSIRKLALVSVALLAVTAARGQTAPPPSALPEGASTPGAAVPPVAAVSPVATTPAIATTPAAALATEATELNLLNTYVTAEGRRMPSQSVAAALTALTSEQITARAITSTLQLATIVPNALAVTTPGLGRDFTLRGLGGSTGFGGSNPAVATFIDNVYVAKPVADSLRGFDLDRVEVLRGPQETLYGHGSAGVLAVTLATPAEAFGGYGEIGYGTDNHWIGRGSLDVPLSDIFAVKLSGYYENAKGSATNTFTGEDVNSIQSSGVRGALRLGFGDHLRWNAAIAYMHDRGENLVNLRCDPGNPANCNGRYSSTGLLSNIPNGAYFPYAPATISGAKAGYPLGTTTDTLLITSNLEWQGEYATLALVTGVVRTAQDFALDFADGRAFPTLLVPAPTVHGYPSGGYTIASQGQFNSISQDIRLTGKLWNDRIDYLVGAYFFRQNNDADTADVQNLGGTGIGTPVTLADRRLITNTDSSAGYGDLNFHATNSVTLTAGVRYTRTTQNLQVTDNRPQCQIQPRPAACFDIATLSANGIAIPTSQSSDKWAPRFVASWQAKPDILVYASASNGGAAGGWNTNATTNSALLAYAPENIWSYELGLKSQWLDDRLRVNFTGFYLNVSDRQTTSSAVTPLGAVDITTANTANYRDKGLELEIIGRPLANLSLYTNIGYQNARYALDASAPDFNAFGTKSTARQQRDCAAQLALGKIPLGIGASNAGDCATGIVDANGNLANPANAPAFTIAVGGTYNFAVPTAGIILSPTVNLAYRSAFETGSANATLYTGAVTSSFNGQAYPANPFGGNVITGSRSASSVLVSAQLAMTTDEGNWRVAIECDNCFDSGVVQSSLGNYGYLAAPMTWTLRAKRVF